jgi:hypothetical protein
MMRWKRCGQHTLLPDWWRTQNEDKNDRQGNKRRKDGNWTKEVA